MNTITLHIDFDGEVTLNNEFTTRAPLNMVWFPDTDLVIKSKYQEVVFNTNTFKPETSPVATATPPLLKGELFRVKLDKPNSKLEIVDGIKVVVAKNNIGYFAIVNDKQAFRLKGLEL